MCCCSTFQPRSWSSNFQFLISNSLPPAFTFRLTTFLNYAIYYPVILTKLIPAPAPNSFPGILLSPTLALTPFPAHSYSFRPPSISGSLHQSNPLFSYSSAFPGTRFFHCFPRFSSTFSCIQRPASHPSDSVPPALRTACPELVEGSLSKGARPSHPADRNFSIPPSLRTACPEPVEGSLSKGARPNHPADRNFSVPPALGTACPELVGGSLSKGAPPNHPADRNFSVPPALVVPAMSLSKGARPNHPADRNFSVPSALRTACPELVEGSLSNGSCRHPFLRTF